MQKTSVAKSGIHLFESNLNVALNSNIMDFKIEMCDNFELSQLFYENRGQLLMTINSIM